MVCTANITRSPYVAALMRKTLVESQLRFRQRVVIESAGTDATPNAPPLPTIATIAYTRGIDIQDHRSRLLNSDMVRDADLVFTMERSQKDQILKRVPEAMGRVHVITEFGRTLDDADARDVIDPTGRDLEEFQEFVATAHKEVGRVLEYMIRTAVIE